MSRISLACIFVAWSAAAAAQDRTAHNDNEYAGSAACAGCHLRIYRLQQSSTHAKSLRQPEAVAELSKSLPFSYEDRPSLSTLTLRLGAGAKIELDATKDNEQQSLVLTWAFGSGTKGITGVGIRPDGTYVESRLSWYASEHTFALTTGATNVAPHTVVESLGRGLTNQQVQECFSCHTTAYTPGQAGPALREMGIHCERCHGPGRKHASLMSGTDLARRNGNPGIVNPGRLDAFSQVKMCGACHGQPPRDTDVAKLRFIEQTPRTVRFPSQRLMLSRCFNESADGLKCTFCHDPHSSISTDATLGDGACKSCHREAAHSSARMCPVATSNCASCHMPKERVMLHSEFRDHWIRVVAKARP